MSWARDGRGSRSIILAVEVVLSSLDLPNARLSQVNESLLLEREPNKPVTNLLHKRFTALVTIEVDLTEKNLGPAFKMVHNFSP